MKQSMKSKDLIYIVLIVVIFGAVAYLGYGQLTGASASKGVSVEVVEPVDAGFSQSGIDRLKDENQAKDFTVPIDLKSGVGTSTPFGQQ